MLCLTPTFGTTTSEAERLLSDRGAQLVRADGHDPDWIRDQLSAATALIVGTQQVDATMLSLGRRLKIVAKHGAGTDNIDVRAATERGIVVTNAALANALAVAEFAVGAMLALARGIVWSDARVRRGTWSAHTGRQLEGSTVGIIGLGAIGRLVAARAAALGMQVVYHDLVTSDGAPDEPWERLPFDELLARSDFVTLHVPLTSTTRGMIGQRELAMMKPTAYLVNLSRGGIVDEPSLAGALAGERLAGAALDVFEHEPVSRHSPLLHLPAAILTPHMAGYTREALAAMSVAVARSIVAVLDGDDPPGRVTGERPG